MCETCRDQDIGKKNERLLMTVVRRSKNANYTNERTTARNSQEKPNGKSRRADDKNKSKNEGRN